MLRKQLILIVETDDLIRQLVERWLNEEGFVVRSDALGGGNPADAGAKPALVIVDVPDPRGADVLVRALEREHGAPVLVISARFRRGLGRSVEAAGRLGVRKVLPKPFTREELLTAVEESIADSP